ncbi:MAG: hypothetical protein WKF58_18545 [Ilumatobacteraceae bacterium]
MAVLIGLFILRQIDDDGDGGATDPDTTLETGDTSDSTDPNATTGTGTGPVNTTTPSTVDVREERPSSWRTPTPRAAPPRR